MSIKRHCVLYRRLDWITKAARQFALQEVELGRKNKDKRKATKAGANGGELNHGLPVSARGGDEHSPRGPYLETTSGKPGGPFPRTLWAAIRIIGVPSLELIFPLDLPRSPTGHASPRQIIASKRKLLPNNAFISLHIQVQRRLPQGPGNLLSPPSQKTN